MDPKTDANIIDVHDLRFRKFLPAETIRLKVRAMASRIARDYAQRDLMVIGVLTGAFVFAADLVRMMNKDVQISFVQLASYHGTQSGKLVEKIPLDGDVTGKHVLIVEDIIDTGNTLAWFREVVKKKTSASVAIATLLLKPDVFQNRFPVEYVGFEIPDAFVIGYGMDYDEAGRNLPSIYQRIND